MIVKTKDISTLRAMVTAKTTLVLIHASWCVHCQMFAPHWDTVQKRLKGKKVQLLSIESEVMKEIQAKDPALFKYLAITPSSKDVYFPKLVLFTRSAKGTVRRSVFTDERAADNVVAFVEKAL